MFIIQLIFKYWTKDIILSRTFRCVSKRVPLWLKYSQASLRRKHRIQQTAQKRRTPRTRRVGWVYGAGVDWVYGAGVDWVYGGGVDWGVWRRGGMGYVGVRRHQCERVHIWKQNLRYTNTSMKKAINNYKPSLKM